MGFEVTPTSVGRGERRGGSAALVVAAAVLAVAAVAVMTSGTEDPPVAIVGATRSAVVVPPPTSEPSSTPRPVAAERMPPPVVDCTDASPETCAIAIEAALEVLTPGLPAVESAVVSHSLLCGDALDCPPHHLRRMVGQIGSVTLEFVDRGPSAWVNVLYRQPGRPADASPRIHAWIARWVARPTGDP
jgi:hypothetical protein